MIHNKKITIIGLCAAFFIAGFIINSLMTTDSVPVVGPLVKNIRIPTSFTTSNANADNGFITKVEYNNKRFSHQIVTIRKGSYIEIKNTNTEEKMWLDSTAPELSTVRGLGEGEVVKLTLENIGEYKISNKLFPQASFTVKVVGE